MANTYTSLHYHIVFSTKNREAWITQSIEERVWEYLGGIARHNDIVPVKIGGIDDHIHLVLSIPPTFSLSKTVQLLKGGSSLWFYETFRRSAFAWQDGYSAFTVSKSQRLDVIRYVEGQREHHRRQTFQEEYRALLDRHGIDYDERYLWERVSASLTRRNPILRVRGPGDESPGYSQSIAPRCWSYYYICLPFFQGGNRAFFPQVVERNENPF